MELYLCPNPMNAMEHFEHRIEFWVRLNYSLHDQNFSTYDTTCEQKIIVCAQNIPLHAQDCHSNITPYSFSAEKIYSVTPVTVFC